mgnify:CR=1 FL=1|tara:strand:+ start:396 stop:635 length:240 start_codon:yes stop_codon:yes gene_type:complete
MKISFEQITCGRCNGAGSFSAYGNIMNGTCFGCGGSGTKLTRNGATAKRQIANILKERLGTPEEARTLMENMKGVTITD